MLVLLAALAATALVAPAVVRLLGRPGFALLAATPAAGFGWLGWHFAQGTFADGGALYSRTPWLTPLHLDLDFRIDYLGALFGMIVLGVGALVLVYCWGYFDSTPGRLRIFAAQMVAFAFAMIGLVTADNMLLLYVFWELTSVLSFLLVGYYGERASSRRSAGQALMVTVLGGLAMLAGIILFGQSTGVWRFSEIAGIEDLTAVPHLTVAIVLLVAGALSKSAIVPAHFWLPGAMAAPTPVSAYLHSAAMVKAGIYLLARLSGDLHVVASWHLVVVPLGVFTMLLGGWMALRQLDLKLILAYGTVSQLGFITSVVAIGSRETLLAGLALTVAHSLFKATLFMVVGAIDHTCGTRDVTKLSGLWRSQPILLALAVLAAASMAGVPPLFGFVAKEAVLEAVLSDDLLAGMPSQLQLVCLVAGSVLTMAYSCYFLYGAFATKPGLAPTAPAHRMAPALWLPPAALVALTVVLGIYPKPVGLSLWHGWTIPLALSAIIIASGAVVYWRRREILELFHFEEPALGNADAAYDSILSGLRKVSLKLTASTQRGSVMINVGVIFIVLATVPLVALLLGDRPNIRMQLWDSPWQGFVAVLIVVMAFAATRAKDRLTGVIFVGMTGYGIAAIFLLHGAPDLALTQVLSETIVMVIFMLVLRKLPSAMRWRGSARGNRFRAWIAVAVGVSVPIVALYAMNSRQATSISQFLPDLAYNIGKGANTVNVMLVDIRSWDTVGEATVLVIAATGVASLIYGTRSFQRTSRRPTLKVVGRRWLAASAETEKEQNRSLMVDVVTRIIFPSIMLVSVYFFFAGHNAPGGGFAGGLVAGLALCLRYLAGGRAELEEAMPIEAGKILGSGMALIAAAALWPMALGLPPLTSAVWDVHLPFADVHVASALLFDAGVYVIVVGLVVHILTSIGGQVDEDEKARRLRALRRLTRGKVTS